MANSSVCGQLFSKTSTKNYGIKRNCCLSVRLSIINKTMFFFILLSVFLSLCLLVSLFHHLVDNYLADLTVKPQKSQNAKQGDVCAQTL